MMAEEKALPVVMLTGFEPFDGDKVNPSWEAVRRMDGDIVRKHRIVTERLPTEFRRSLTVLRQAIRKHQPELVLCVGLAGGRAQLALERVAINIDDARIPDNTGHQPIDVPIARDGPAAYFSTLPIKAILLALQAQGLPVEISQSAGTYVCNHVFYGLMHALSAHPGVRGGFMHVPFSPQQASHRLGVPSLAETEVVRALRIVIETALATRRDRRVSAGTLS